MTRRRQTSMPKGWPSPSDDSVWQRVEEQTHGVMSQLTGASEETDEEANREKANRVLENLQNYRDGIAPLSDATNGFARQLCLRELRDEAAHIQSQLVQFARRHPEQFVQSVYQRITEGTLTPDEGARVLRLGLGASNNLLIHRALSALQPFQRNQLNPSLPQELASIVVQTESPQQATEEMTEEEPKTFDVAPPPSRRRRRIFRRPDVEIDD